MSIIALLALSMTTISPVMAVTKEAYYCEMEIYQMDPGKEWVTGGGIYHAKDAYWSGSYDGTLGIGAFDVWYEHIALDQDTGKGTFSGKYLITTPDGTMAGSFRGKITSQIMHSGTFVGTHGTGGFEGVKIMGDCFGTQTTAYAQLVGIGTVKGL